MTDNRTAELLPCPICGGQPDFQHFNITPNVRGRIICSCGIELRQGKNDTEDDIRIIWNTRSDYAVQASNERKAEQAIAATLGSDTKPCYAADENYRRCKYSVNRGWCDDAPFLVWDDTGHLFITMGGLKTWDVTDDAKKWFVELGSGTCEVQHVKSGPMYDVWRYTCCGYEHAENVGEESIPQNFCPKCGAKAVER